MTEALRDYVGTVMRSLRSQTARSTGLVMTGNLTSGLLRFAVTALLVRAVADKDTWGTMVVFIALMDVAAMFCDAGLLATQVRFTAARTEENTLPILRKCVVLRLGLIGAVAGTAWLGYPWFMNLGKVDPAYGWLYSAALGAGIVMSLISVAQGVLQSYERYGKVAVLASTGNAVRLVPLGLLVVLGMTSQRLLFGVFFTAPLVTAAVATGLAALALRGVTQRKSSSVTYGELVRFMLPVAGKTILAILILRADVFLLKALTNESVLADYGVAFTVGFCFPLLTRSVFIVLLPKVSRMSTSDALSAYRKRILRLYPVVLLAAGLATIVLPVVLTLFGEEYKTAAPILRVLLLGFGVDVIYAPLGLVFYALKRPQCDMVIHLIQFVLLVPIQIVAISLWGGVGAALGLLIVRVVVAILTILWTRKAVRDLCQSERGSAVSAHTTGPGIQ